MIKLDISILWNIINILVLFLILRKFLIKPVLDIIEKRQKLIDDSFDTAKAKQMDADKLKAEYTEKMAKVDAQTEDIIAKAQRDMALAYDRTLMEAKDNALRITKEAEEIVEQKKRQAMAEAQEHIATLVMDATEKLISEKDLANTNAQAYDDFILKAGESNDTDKNEK